MIDVLTIGVYKRFSWDNDEGLLNLIKNTPDDSEEGYILEGDLNYPESLHELHNSFQWLLRG